MQTFINFKKFRTREMLIVALYNFLQKKKKGRIYKYQCPHPHCPASGNFALKPIADAPVAYCFGCHKTFDALELVKLAMDSDYLAAAEMLNDRFCNG